VKWYRLAAEQGVADAQARLGSMYLLGLGVPQDYVLSHMWLNIATAHADSEEQKKIIKLSDLMAKKMTAQQIAKAQELARKCTANKFKGC
jgi:TPR repeat protein